MGPGWTNRRWGESDTHERDSPKAGHWMGAIPSLMAGTRTSLLHLLLSPDVAHG